MGKHQVYPPTNIDVGFPSLSGLGKPWVFHIITPGYHVENPQKLEADAPNVSANFGHLQGAC